MESGRCQRSRRPFTYRVCAITQVIALPSHPGVRLSACMSFFAGPRIASLCTAGNAPIGWTNAPFRDVLLDQS